MERTDSDRLKWILENSSARCASFEYPIVVPGAVTNDKIISAIDAAMSASEAGEMEAAWKWFRESPGLEVRERTGGLKQEWAVRLAKGQGFMPAHWDTREQALLMAYRASKGK